MLQVSWNNWNVFFCHGIWILIVIASLTWRRSTTICEVKYLMLLSSHTLTLVDTTSYKFKVKMIHIFKNFLKIPPVLLWVKMLGLNIQLCKKCLYSELFWSLFSRIRIDYGKIRTGVTTNADTFHAVLLWLKICPKSKKYLLKP